MASIPRKSVELAGFVSAEDKEYIFAGAEGLFKDGYVVRLSCPQPYICA